MEDDKKRELIRDYGEFFGELKSKNIEDDLLEEDYLGEYLEAYAIIIAQEKN